MKKLIIKTAAIAMLFLSGINTQAGFLNGAKNFTLGTAEFTGQVGLAILCSIPGQELNQRVVPAFNKGDYQGALIDYSKSLGVGLAALTAANAITAKNAGFALATGKTILQQTGTLCITTPINQLIHERYLMPLMDAIQRKDYDETFGRCIIYLAAGYAILKGVGLHDGLKTLFAGAGKSLIITPTILLGHEMLKNVFDRKLIEEIEKGTMPFEFIMASIALG